MPGRESQLSSATDRRMGLERGRSRCVACVAELKGQGRAGMAREVGVVGLGIMGGAFAQNLVKAGWHVVGYDIDPARRRVMAKAGVEIAKDAQTLAAPVPTIIPSLPKPAALDATVAAIVGAVVKPRVIVEASTFTI